MSTPDRLVSQGLPHLLVFGRQQLRGRRWVLCRAAQGLLEGTQRRNIHSSAAGLQPGQEAQERDGLAIAAVIRAAQVMSWADGMSILLPPWHSSKGHSLLSEGAQHCPTSTALRWEPVLLCCAKPCSMCSFLPSFLLLQHTELLLLCSPTLSRS